VERGRGRAQHEVRGEVRVGRRREGEQRGGQVGEGRVVGHQVAAGQRDLARVHVAREPHRRPVLLGVQPRLVVLAQLPAFGSVHAAQANYNSGASTDLTAFRLRHWHRLHIGAFLEEEAILKLHTHHEIKPKKTLKGKFQYKNVCTLSIIRYYLSMSNGF